MPEHPKEMEQTIDKEQALPHHKPVTTVEWTNH